MVYVLPEIRWKMELPVMTVTFVMVRIPVQMACVFPLPHPKTELPVMMVTSAMGLGPIDAYLVFVRVQGVRQMELPATTRMTALKGIVVPAAPVYPAPPFPAVKVAAPPMTVPTTVIFAPIRSVSAEFVNTRPIPPPAPTGIPAPRMTRVSGALVWGRHPLRFAMG